MRTLLLTLFSLFALTISAQEIISQTQEIVNQGDTLYFVNQTTVKENGTAFPDTLINKYLLGDSTVAANYLFDVPFQISIEVEEGMRKALRRNFATSVFNQIGTLFTAITGKTLYQDSGTRFFSSLEGRYRVFRQDGTDFFANVTQVGNGTLRLIGETAEGTFVLNPNGPNSFTLVNFDHDQVGGGENFYFYWDGISVERKTFWPAQRVSGATTIFRIVKVQ